MLEYAFMQDAIREMEDTPDLSKDPVSRFFGPEHPGRVRGFGHGVSPSTVNVRVYSSGGSSSQRDSELRAEVSGLKETVEALQRTVDRLVSQGVGPSSVRA